ncbi:MAG: class I SAM-dependent methyltransferase [Reyranella sp.]|nr:MAG: class I SAM-dependent methyltransferase [Reyranella sp.]
MREAAFDYETEISAGFYDRIYRRRRGVRYSWHDLKFRSVVEHLDQPRRVLDVGCGPGTFIGNYLDGIDALGVDLSAAQVAYASETYGTPTHRFVAQPVGALAATGERFDAVTMIELIEHLAPEDAVRLLTDVRKLLSPDGLLVVTTPNYGSLWPLIELGVNAVSTVSYADQHINKYRRRQFANHLAQAGYRDVKVTTVLGFAPFAAVFGLGAANALNSLENGVGHLGVGNLLLATARP